MHRQVKGRQCRGEFLAAAADVGTYCPEACYSCLKVYRGTSARCSCPIHGDLPRQNQGSRLGAAGSQTTLPDQHIETLAGCHARRYGRQRRSRFVGDVPRAGRNRWVRQCLAAWVPWRAGVRVQLQGAPGRWLFRAQHHVRPLYRW